MATIGQLCKAWVTQVAWYTDWLPRSPGRELPPQLKAKLWDVALPLVPSVHGCVPIMGLQMLVKD